MDGILPRQPLPTNSIEDDKDLYMEAGGRSIPTSFRESMSAAYDLANLDSGLGLYRRWRDMNKVEDEGGDVLMPQELNRMFPQMETPFTRPTTVRVAQEMAKRIEEKRAMEESIAKGPQGMFYGMARFGAGLAPHAIDPLEIGAGLVAGAGLGYIAELGWAGKNAITLAMTAARPTAGQLAIRLAVENAVTNAAQETAAVSMAHREGQEYTFADAMKNVALTTVAGVGVHMGGRYVIGKAAGFMRGLGERAEDTGMRSAFAQTAMDRSVDVDPIIRDHVIESSGRTTGTNRFLGAARAYTPIERFEDLHGRQLYHGSPEARGSFADSTKVVIEDDFGTGIYLTDNHDVANGYAARKGSDVDGKVFEMSAKEDLNLINLEKPLDPEGPAAEALRPVLEESFGKRGAELMLQDHTGKQILEGIRSNIEAGRLPEDMFDTVSARLHEAGFDGYRHEGGQFMGVDGQRHNVVMLFDHPEHPGVDKLQEHGAVPADRDVIPEMTQEEHRQLAERLNSHKSDAMYDPVDEQALDEHLANPHQDPDLPQLEAELKETMDELKDLREQGFAVEDEKVAEQVAEIKKVGDEEDFATKGMANCMLMGGDVG